jgi:hypothetical protein
MKIINQVISDNNISIDNTEKLLTGTALATTAYALKSVFGKFKKNINENEIRYWVNNKFLLHPPLKQKK